MEHDVAPHRWSETGPTDRFRVTGLTAGRYFAVAVRRSGFRPPPSPGGGVLRSVGGRSKLVHDRRPRATNVDFARVDMARVNYAVSHAGQTGSVVGRPERLTPGHADSVWRVEGIFRTTRVIEMVRPWACRALRVPKDKRSRTLTSQRAPLIPPFRERHPQLPVLFVWRLRSVGPQTPPRGSSRGASQ